MPVNIESYYKVKSFLDKNGIDSVLYGSLGVSVYLGNFKEFNDIDLLIDRKYLTTHWENFQLIMANEGFSLINEREHEFTNDQGLKIAFSGTDILERDNICNLNSGVIEINKDGKKILTLTKEVFIKAYLFSSKDGYRKEKRGKNDLDIVKALQKS